MNAIWVGLFYSNGRFKRIVIPIEEHDWSTIMFLIRVVCDEQAQQGWYLQNHSILVEDDNGKSKHG